jgi:hypothetical protein
MLAIGATGDQIGFGKIPIAAIRAGHHEIIQTHSGGFWNPAQFEEGIFIVEIRNYHFAHSPLYQPNLDSQGQRFKLGIPGDSIPVHGTHQLGAIRQLGDVVMFETHSGTDGGDYFVRQIDRPGIDGLTQDGSIDLDQVVCFSRHKV